MPWFTIPWPQDGAVKFPKRCVVCAAESAHERKLIVQRNIQKKQSAESREIAMQIPYCSRCFAKDSKLFYITLAPFLLAGLIAAPIIFIYGLPFTPDMPSHSTATGLIVPGAMALIGGIIVGSIAEIIVRVFAFPFLGRSVFSIPIFAVELFADVSAIYGLAARIRKDGNALELRLENSSIDAEVKRLNSARD